MERFEDIVVWQRARELVQTVYWSTEECRDYDYRSQLRRAALSVMANIAEGFESSSGVEFRRYLGMAKASNGEVRSLCYAGQDLGYLESERAGVIFSQTEEVRKMVIALRKKVADKKF